MIVGCSDGAIYVFELERKELMVVVKLLSYVVVEQKGGVSVSFITSCREEEEEEDRRRGKGKKENRLIPNKILADFTEGTQEIFVCYSKGTIQRICLKDVLANIHPSENMTKKQNYNAYRCCSENF